MKEKIALVLLGAFLSIFGFMIGFGLFLKRKLGRHIVLFFEHPVVQKGVRKATESVVKEFIDGFILEVDKPKRYTYTPKEKNREIWADFIKNKETAKKKVYF